MVVDVHDGHPPEQLGVIDQHPSHAFEVAAVADHDQVVVQVGVGRRPKALDAGHEVVHRRHGVRAHGRRPPTERFHDEGVRERRAERVGLWVLVADGQHGAGRAKARHDLCRHGGHVGACQGRRRWMGRTHEVGGARIGDRGIRLDGFGLELCPPWGRQRLGHRSRIRFVARLEFLEDGQHARALLRGLIEPQVELRDAADAKLAEAMPNEWHRPPKGPDGRLALVRGPDDRDPDRAVSQVGGDFDARDGHETDARILDLTGDDAADLLAEQLVDALRSLGHGGTPNAQALWARETVCCVKHSTMSPSSSSW